MKKAMLFISLLFAAVTFMSFSVTKQIVNDTYPGNEKFVMPDNVKAIIDNKCYDCHHSGSRNMKGKMKLKFDKLADLKTHKLVGKLDNIAEAVEEGDMPPKKAIKKYPELKLTQEEAKTLVDWANGIIKEVTGE